MNITISIRIIFQYIYILILVLNIIIVTFSFISINFCLKWLTIDCSLHLAHGLIGQLLFGTKGGVKGQRPCGGDPDCIGRHKS